jgi:glycosyltransferase involved in cell wall biosynthesis
VLPSISEGLPVVVLEAFAAAVPVVATAVGGTPEVVVDDDNGHLVPPGEPRLLARRIIETLRDESGRIALGARGRRLVLERFTFDAQCHNYEILFKALTRSRNTSRRAKVIETSIIG